jgi:hypothetical protein
MIFAIVAAEAAFWIVLVTGLTTRYVLRRRVASTWLLSCVPLVDVALVVFVAIDVARGAEPVRAHALACTYLGVTVAFGRATIAWADTRFRHRFAGGPPPSKPPNGSPAAVRALWIEWLRVVLAAVIAATLLLVLIAATGFHVPASTDQLADDPYWGSMATLAVVTAVWFLAGPAFAGTGARAKSNR